MAERDWTLTDIAAAEDDRAYREWWRGSDPFWPYEGCGAIECCNGCDGAPDYCEAARDALSKRAPR